MADTRHFLAHLGEMFLAMIVGMAILDGIVEGILAVGGTSYSVMTDDAPAVVAIVLMFNMTAPMLLWMRIRHHEASEISEMAVGMVLVGSMTVFLLWLSVIDAGAICGFECGLMLPAMIATMLLHPWRARRLRSTRVA